MSIIYLVLNMKIKKDLIKTKMFKVGKIGMNI